MRVNIINRQIIPFSYLLFEFYPLLYFTSAFQDLHNSVPWVPPFALRSGLQNAHLHAKDDTFKLVNIDILFLQKVLKVSKFSGEKGSLC